MSSTVEAVCEFVNERGQGVCYFSNPPILIADNWLPSERAVLKILHKTTHYAKAQVVELLNTHPGRIHAPCPVFASCGGCHLQHLNYTAQLELKSNQLRLLLRKYGIDIEPCKTWKSAPTKYRYKLLLPLRKSAGNVVAGFFYPGSQELIAIASSRHSKEAIENITPCLVQTPELNQLIAIVPRIVSQMGIEVEEVSGQQLPKKVGVLRYLFARQAYGSNSLHITLGVSSFAGPWTDLTQKIAQELQPQIKLVGAGLLLHDRQDNRWLHGQRQHLWGSSQLHETMLGLEFDYDPLSFFQINPAISQAMWLQICQWVKDYGDGQLLELYCGTGLLANWLAKEGIAVLGMERDSQAVECAKALAERSLSNAEFMQWDLEKQLPPTSHWKTIMVNPPRRGLSESVLETLALPTTKNIIYMACGLEALARDSARLQEMGFKVKELRPYDMFAQTSHLEVLAFFERA